MLGRYSLTARQARFCRLAAACLWVATAIAASNWVIFGIGIGGTWEVTVDTNSRLTATLDRTSMLPDELVPVVRASPQAAAAFEAHVQRPDVRVALTALTALRILPYVALFGFAAVVLQRLGGRRMGALAAALPWLRRTALAAVAVTLVPLASDSVRGAVASLGVPGNRRFDLTLDADLTTIGLNLLLALTMVSISWALEAGTRATRDIDAFV